MTALMHEGETPTDAALVRRLLAAQFPHWAPLDVTRVASSGTDNAMYRVGAALVARLPRVGWAVDAAPREAHWLPLLAPHLPLPIPAPLALGAPGEGYPFPWAVYRWLEGENPVVGALADPQRLARELAAFVSALWRVPGTGELEGPPSGRAEPLLERDGATRDAISRCEGMVDTRAVTRAWDAALAAPAPVGPPVWIHGDLGPGNLLLRQGERQHHGQLGAVIDFASAGLGDRAVDLLPAWNLLPPSARPAFRAAVGADDACWARGRGWALSVALLQLPYY